jgi:gliding motility-associated-like protein
VAEVKNGACASTTSMVKEVIVLSITATVSNDTTIVKGSSVTLTASGGSEYFWNPSSGLSSSSVPNPIASPQETTSYQVIVLNSFGCSDTSYILVTVIPTVDSTSFKIPNLITPNGDGYNDTWVISGMNSTSSSVLIFNAYGEIIFSASPYLNNWDAIWKGNLVPDGTYYYILSGKEVSGAEVSIKGNLTVISGL